MSTAVVQKKRVFIASGREDALELQKAIEKSGLDAVTWEEAAAPGATWVESLHRCINDADIIIGIAGDPKKDANVFFELGVASSFNKPILLFLTPEYPTELLPPSGIPCLRVDLRDEEAVLYWLNQMPAIMPRLPAQARNGFQTHPIGELADELLNRLSQAGPRELEQIVFEAIKASGVPTIVAGSDAEDKGVDFVVWSNDFEPTITNPMLVECKSSLRTSADMDAVVGRMFRALDTIRNGFGLVIYKEAEKSIRAAPKSLPLIFISAEQFLTELRGVGLAELVRKLRNQAAHGY